MSTAPFPYRLAAFDLDGTLLAPDHTITERTRRALLLLAGLGVQCVLASGRTHESTARYASALGLEAPIISYNGAMVRLPHSSAPLRHTPLPPGVAEPVIRFCEDQGLHLNLYLDDVMYVRTLGHWARYYQRQTGSVPVPSGELTRFAGCSPTKLLIIDEPDSILELEGRFRRELGEAAYVTRTNPEYLEFMHPSVSKAGALLDLAQRAGHGSAECLAFGDGDNDAPMLAAAGLGVAMPRASAAAVAAANRHQQEGGDEALALAIERIIAEGADPS
jgi:Cof subfamily protein (haloacid dehalogenase superfamily)